MNIRALTSHRDYAWFVPLMIVHLSDRLSRSLTNIKTSVGLLAAVCLAVVRLVDVRLAVVRLSVAVHRYLLFLN